MATYTAKDITVLEGLEPVRKRPGMYIGGVGSAGLHHLVWEILDNSIDEAMNGYASNIAVTLHDDGASITVTDDGRGIPVDDSPALIVYTSGTTGPPKGAVLPRRAIASNLDALARGLGVDGRDDVSRTRCRCFTSTGWCSARSARCAAAARRGTSARSRRRPSPPR